MTQTQLTPHSDWSGPVTTPQLEQTLAALSSAGAELRTLSTVHITEQLGLLEQRWAHDPGWRASCASSVAAATGLSPQMVEWSLDDLMRRLTPAALQALVRNELGSLEPFRAPRSTSGPCARGAHPPHLVLQILAGTVPPVAVEAIILSLLCRAPLLLKTSSSEPHVARWLLLALREMAPELASAIAVLTWSGGDDTLDTLACSRASTVVAYGNNSTINALYHRCTFPTRFFGYGHRISFAIIGPDDGSGAIGRLPQLGRDLALDAAAYEQQGCMSPHTIFVASNCAWHLEDVARSISDGFEELHHTLPRGTLPLPIAAAWSQARAVAEFSGRWQGTDHGGTVSHTETAFHPSPGGRLLHVVPFDTVPSLTRALTPLRGSLSTVGLHWPSPDIDGIIDLLGTLGARRFTRPGRMQRPVWLRDHDGRPRIGDWVEWTDVEPLI